MSRERFGAMGALLGEGELARALAAIGVVYQRGDADLGIDALLNAADSGFTLRRTTAHGEILEVPVRMRALRAFARDVGGGGAPVTWQQLEAKLRTLVPAGARVRYRIELAGSDDSEPGIEPAWVARTLGTPSLDARGVYVSQPVAPRKLTWEWPLRIGVLAGESDGGFRTALETGRWPHLYQLVDAAREACDLALIPAGLRDAMRIVTPTSPHASAAIVVGDTTDNLRDTGRMLLELRERLGGGAVALAGVPSHGWALWFTALLAELSHNATLDTALVLASRPDLAPPLIVADRTFIAAAVLDEIARRIGRAAAVAPDAPLPAGDWFLPVPPGASPTIRILGNALAASAQAIEWLNETGDATALAELRRLVEAASGAPLALPPLAVGAVVRTTRGARRDATPRPVPSVVRSGPRTTEAVPDAAPVERSVMVDLAEQAAQGTWTPTGQRITPGSVCRLVTFIGMPRTGMVVAPEPIRERTLPPSATGHELTIAFVPLWKVDAEAFAPAQMLPLVLPPAGDTPPVTFYFTAPAALAQFRARIVVLFGLRVLQTLMLDAPDGTLKLAVENRVSGDFGERTEAPPFKASLVVNHSPQGNAGIAAFTGDGVTFIEPAGLDELVTQISGQLKVLNLAAEAPPLGDQDVENLLRNLAVYGSQLTRKLKRQPEMSAVLGADRLQVVDARDGAYLPIEFFYDGMAPLDEAKRCPTATDALGDIDVHHRCPRKDSEEFYCPAAFWGFSRCLERQPFAGRGVTLFRQPRRGANTLKPLERALFAASERVRQQDLDPPAGLESILTSAAGSVTRARSWNDWKDHVASVGPSLLVLVPHSLESNVPGIPALEISGNNLASANLAEKFVTTDPGRTPVVLLLGCSTALTEVPFLNFVGQFKDSGAALVIGTIATIRGRQVGAFVRALLDELHNAAGAGNATFDEVFLRVKQRLLAAGDPFVLSLMAYGDTGWRVQA